MWAKFLESNDRCTVVGLMPGKVARFKVAFSSDEIGKHTGKIRLFVVDNPYENLAINLEAESYMEAMVLYGLEMHEDKDKANTGHRDSVRKRQRASRISSEASRQNSLTSGKG